IKGHAVAVALAQRESGQAHNDLFDRLGADSRFPLDADAILRAVGQPIELTGRAGSQVTDLVDRVKRLLSRFPAATAYRPEPIL
ncbi:MAG: adenylosuccinate lyase, partial [Acidimicrobiia bacterium]|nr:adenylosuccinate lyase [Acidimicrobiia bacterium]